MRKMIFLLPLLLAGCAANAPIHPGTYNTFDSQTYDALVIADSVIQSTKADITANKFPANILPNVKTALNGLITAYNAADIMYCGVPVTSGGTAQCSPSSYHGALQAGATPPVTQVQVQTAMNQVASATASLSTAKAGQ